MELIKSVDTFIETPAPIDPPRHHRGFHPSSASCPVKNEYDEEITVGKCMRASYWSSKSVKQSNPMNARGKRITSVGKMVERWEVDRYKEMGIWRGNNVRFYDVNNLISGEVDAFVFDKGVNGIIGVEIKTGYGYQFQKEVIGRPDRKGKPKLDHLMQVMIYMNFFRNISLFKMVYIDRGNAARAEFNITIDKTSGGAKVDGKKFANELTIPAIIHRYEKLGEYLKDGVIPPRDYQLQYSDDKLQFLYDSNRLNKGAKKEFEKNKTLEMGDWRCSYCEYKDYCWKGDEK